MTNPPPGTSAKNIRFVSRCDQGGRPDGVQVIVHKGHAFIGHMFADGYSVVDVRDPLHPKTVAFVAAPKNTRSHHLQIHGDILLAVNGPNIWAMQQYASQADYYGKSLIDSVTDRAALRRGLARLRRFEPGGSARNLVPGDAWFRRPSHLVGRRALRLCVGASRGLHRSHLGGDRCVEPGKAVARRTMVVAGHAPRRRRDGARLVRQAHRAASSHQRRQHRLCRVARRRLHNSRFERSTASETAQPPQLCPALWRRRAYAAAAARPQATGARRRGDVGELRQWARLHLGDRRT